MKVSELDEGPSFVMHCDFPGCSEEFRGDELSVVEEGWNLSDIDIDRVSKKIALCSEHSDRMISFVKKEIRDIESVDED